MVKSYYQSTYKTREFLRPKLAKHKKFYNFARALERTYKNLTGFAHVLPDFYIIGAQKCGTSALYDYLVQHPNIHPCTTKEPRFFDKYYHRGINWYKSCFPLKIKKNLETKLFHRKFLTGEATERYLEHPHVPKRLKNLTPNAKIIIILRNPIDRAYSHYNMRHNSKKEELSFEEAIEKESQRTKNEYELMLNDENYYSFDYFHHSYLDRSIYVDKIQNWMKIFPKNQFLILQSEPFFKNPDETYQKVLEFLQLPKWQLKKYEKIGSGKYSNPKMKSETRSKLSKYFRPHNEKLFKLLNMTYDWN